MIADTTMEDPREIEWQRRLDYYSRMSAIRIAFEAVYAQAIPTIQRERYYKSKLPKLTEWVAEKRNTPEGPDPDFQEDEHSALEGVQVITDARKPVPGSAQEEPIILSEDEKNTPNPGEKTPSVRGQEHEAKSATASETNKPITKPAIAPSRGKRQRTEIERLLDINPSFVPVAEGDHPSPAAKRTRSKRNSLQGPSAPSKQVSASDLKSTEKLPAANPAKPPSRKSLPGRLSSDKPAETSQVLGELEPHLPKEYLFKLPTPTARKPKHYRPPPPPKKAKSKLPASGGAALGYLLAAHSTTPFQIDVIFNRYPALYRLRRRYQGPVCGRLSIHTLMIRCRKAVRKNMMADVKPNVENSVGNEGAVVFLMRNTRRVKRVWHAGSGDGK